MLISYVRFAPQWVAELYDDLPLLLAADQSGYDAFGVGGRLPDAAPAQIGGPRTRRGLLTWTAIAAAGLALAAFRRRGRQAIVLGLLLASTFVDLYMAYVGDSVEVQRHMVGPLSRMALVMALCFAVGADTLVELVRRRLGWIADDVERAAGACADVDVLEPAT
ncbi:MAG: hypothetical protein ABIW84_04825, partial [Ilumatobacteraceae bacterium]